MEEQEEQKKKKGGLGGGGGWRAASCVQTEITAYCGYIKKKEMASTWSRK